MSLVGPRPHALAHDNKYRFHITAYTNRYRVKTRHDRMGTGKWIAGRNRSFEQMAERVKLDLWYINNWSPGLDIP